MSIYVLDIVLALEGATKNKTGVRIPCPSEFVSSSPRAPHRAPEWVVRVRVSLCTNPSVTCPCSVMEHSALKRQPTPFQGEHSYYRVLPFNKDGELERTVNIPGD